MVATDKAVPATVTANSDFTEWTVTRGRNFIVLDSDDIDQTLEIEDTTYYFELDTTNKLVKVTTGAFAAAGGGTTVGEAHVFEVDDLLTDFNAVDWDVLDAGGFSTTIPDSVDAMSDITDTVSYPQYLWLMEKDVEKGSTGTINSRNVAVFVLTAVVADDTNTTQFNLTFRRLA